MPRKGYLTRDDLAPKENYMGDIARAAALVAVVTVALRFYPLKSGLVFSVLARRIRATSYKQHTLVTIDGVPWSLWSVRIPHKKGNTYDA